MNAIELDWRIGRAGDGPEQQTPRASPASKAPRMPDDVEVTSGLPAWPSSAVVRNGWPMATFRVPGARGGSRTLELDVSWMRFPEGSGEYRVLAWNGRRYRSIRPAFDPVRKIVSALVPIGERLVVVRLIPCRRQPAIPSFP
jgi:hypothetical protein